MGRAVSLRSVLDRVDAARRQLQRAREHAELGGELAAEFFEILTVVLAGSAAEDELALLHHTRARFDDDLAELRHTTDTAQRLLEHWTQTLDQGALPDTAPAGAASAPHPAHVPEPPRATEAVGGWCSAAGDRYPERAGWARPLLVQPYSPPHSGVRVEGYARPLLPPSEATLPFTPGGGRWCEEAKALLGAVGAWRQAIGCASHVEVQTVAWMRSAGPREASLVINRPPCGSQGGRGCHQLLPLLLPAGYRLLVSATLGDRPYQHDYLGRSPR